MDERIPTNKLSGVSETLLIPLVGRALASKQYPELGFSDPLATQMIEQIDFDASRLAKSKQVVAGGAIRAKLFDDVARKFFAQHPTGTGISLGAGLCTRFHRLDNGTLQWIDLDLPEVIELKRKLLPETSRYRIIAKSLLDFSWIVQMMDQIKVAPDSPVLIISEGVFLYFDALEIKKLITQAAAVFPVNSEMLLDYCHPFLAKNSRRLTPVKNKVASFRWVIRSPKEIETWDNRLKLLRTISITGNISGVAGMVARAFKWMTGKHVYAIAHFRKIQK